MSKVKLYGGYSRAAKKSGAAVAGEKKKKRKRTAVDRIISVLLVLVALEGLYCTAVFSDLGFIKKYREMWIQTAMSTMRHQWLATAFLPSCVIDEVMAKVERAQQAHIRLARRMPADGVADGVVLAEDVAGDGGPGLGVEQLGVGALKIGNYYIIFSAQSQLGFRGQGLGEGRDGVV